MCEIAIIDPREYSAEKQYELGRELFRRMGDGLGVVYVEDSDSGLQYTTYKQVEPDEESLLSFITQNQEEKLRAIFHARLRTHGDVSHQNVHPLAIECDKCSVNYVIHNGVLRNYKNLKRKAESEGHNIKTDVDSELLAHQYESVPTDFEHKAYQRGQAAYILLNEEAMYVYSGRGYRMAEDGQMARSAASIDVNAEKNYERFILQSENA